MKTFNSFVALSFALSAVAGAQEKTAPSGYSYEVSNDPAAFHSGKGGLKITIKSEEELRYFMEDYLQNKNPLAGADAISFDFKGDDFKDLKFLEPYVVNRSKSSDGYIATVSPLHNDTEGGTFRKVFSLKKGVEHSKSERVKLLDDFVNIFADHSACQKLERFGLKFDYSDRDVKAESSTQHSRDMCSDLAARLGYMPVSAFDVMSGKKKASDPWSTPDKLNPGTLKFVKGLKKAQDLDLKLVSAYYPADPKKLCKLYPKNEIPKAEPKAGYIYNAKHGYEDMKCLTRELKKLGYEYDVATNEWLKADVNSPWYKSQRILQGTAVNQ